MSHPMTITEKILAAHAGLEEVTPGQLINARVDIALGNDITAPIAIKEFKQAGGGKVFDPERVVLVADHFAPNKDIPSAIQCRTLRQFAQEQHLQHFYDGWIVQPFLLSFKYQQIGCLLVVSGRSGLEIIVNRRGGCHAVAKQRQPPATI